MNHKHVLRRLGACRQATDWYNNQDSQDAWESCPRGDWLLWLAEKLEIDHKSIVLAACDCAELSLKYVPGSEDRSRKLIEAARAWCRDEASIDDVRNAADAIVYAVAAAAAYAADAVGDAVYAVAAAAAYAADAVIYATDVADAADAADAAGDAAAADAYADAGIYATDAADTVVYGAAADARPKCLAVCADIVRKYISWEMIADKL